MYVRKENGVAKYDVSSLFCEVKTTIKLFSLNHSYPFKISILHITIGLEEIYIYTNISALHNYNDGKVKTERSTNIPHYETLRELIKTVK